MARVVQPGEHVPPVIGRDAFHCLHCHVLSPQEWTRLLAQTTQGGWRTSWVVSSRCLHCDRPTYWYLDLGKDPDEEQPSGFLLWPWGSSSAPPPHPDLPDDVRADYEEASGIVERSPRGACALLRLAAQKLMVDLGESGGNLNNDVASLVRKGLPADVQQALDAVRVVGNEAVHPGELDLRDDTDTATALFGLLNFIVEQRISQPKKLAALYGTLPPAKLAAIQQRDAAAAAESGSDAPAEEP